MPKLFRPPLMPATFWAGTSLVSTIGFCFGLWVAGAYWEKDYTAINWLACPSVPLVLFLVLEAYNIWAAKKNMSRL